MNHEARTEKVGCFEFTTMAGNKEEGAGISALWKRYNTDSEIRCLRFDLAPTEFFALVKGNCFYCGDEPETRYLPSWSIKSCNRSYSANGIDRVDNLEGYTVENCVPCCRFCNRAKTNHTPSYFLAKIAKITVHCKLLPKVV